MRKIFTLLIIVSIGVSLSGCLFKEITLLQEMNIEYYDEEVETDRTMSLYSDKDDSLYVELEEFLSLTFNHTTFTNVTSEEDGARVSYSRKNSFFMLNDRETYNTYSIEFDFQENSITLSDIRFVEKFDKYSDKYFRNHTLTSYEEKYEESPVTIFLSDYDLEVIYQDGEVYVPYDLAAYLFTGTHFQFLLTAKRVIVFEEFYGNEKEDSSLYEFLHNALNDDGVFELGNTVDSINFLRLLFENFHGLKDSISLKSDYMIDDVDANEIIKSMINDLDDPHTIIKSSIQYDGPRYSVSERNTLLDEWYATEHCETTNDSGAHAFYRDDIMFIRFDGFLTDRSLGNLFMSRTTGYDTVVIDLTCNGGGYSSVAGEIYSYMHEGPYKIYEKNYNGSEPIMLEYKYDENNYIESNYYVLTSRATYSAGSNFVQTVKNNGGAEIIGERTMGGVCSVDWITLSSGYVLTVSSLNCDANSYNTVVDNGVFPDKFLEITDSFYDEVVDYIKSKSE